MLELPAHLGIRAHRLEASYTAARLNAIEGTRHLARPFEEAADKLRQLEEEEARLEFREVDIRASLETADDEWDDVVVAFRRRLLELANNDVDAPIYRQYFADIPSHATELGYAAEILISKELEAAIASDRHADLAAFGHRLEEKRLRLEAIVHERARFEVDAARFENRVALAKSILAKLRRVLFAQLEELALDRGLGREWCARFYLHHEEILEALEADGSEEPLELGPGTERRRQLPEGSRDA